MARKINVLTLLIFAYSFVVCLTCKKDFSKEGNIGTPISAEKLNVPYMANNPMVLEHPAIASVSFNQFKQH